MDANTSFGASPFLATNLPSPAAPSSNLGEILTSLSLYAKEERMTAEANTMRISSIQKELAEMEERLEVSNNQLSILQAKLMASTESSEPSAKSLRKRVILEPEPDISMADLYLYAKEQRRMAKAQRIMLSTMVNELTEMEERVEVSDQRWSDLQVKFNEAISSSLPHSSLVSNKEINGVNTD